VPLIILRYTHHTPFVGLRAHVMTWGPQHNGHNTIRTWQSTLLLQLTPTNNVSRKEMPTLTPSYLPPPAISAFPSPPCASSNGTRFSAITPTSPKQDAVTQRSDVPSVRKRALKVPFVKLDTPTIQEDMAASLAVALLGHVLFLKSQVPLCAASLIIKMSHDLLNS
jgi:hypothetical protein